MKITKQRLKEIVLEELQISQQESQETNNVVSVSREFLQRILETLEMIEDAEHHQDEINQLEQILNLDQDDSHKFNGLGFAQSRE